MPDELEPLRFAAGKSVERLAESQITEPDFLQHVERSGERLLLPRSREKLDRLAHGHLEHFVNRFAVEFHFQHVRLEAPAFAFRAAHVKIAQELHLDLLETGAAATLAAAAAGIEGECARGQALRHRFRLRGEKFAHPIVKPEVKNRRRTRRAGERRLVDHHDLADAMRAGHALAGAGFLRSPAPRARSRFR